MPLTDAKRKELLLATQAMLRKSLDGCTGLPITIVCKRVEEYAMIAAAVDTMVDIVTDRDAMKEKGNATLLA